MYFVSHNNASLSEKLEMKKDELKEGCFISLLIPLLVIVLLTWYIIIIDLVHLLCRIFAT